MYGFVKFAQIIVYKKKIVLYKYIYKLIVFTYAKWGGTLLRRDIVYYFHPFLFLASFGSSDHHYKCLCFHRKMLHMRTATSHKPISSSQRDSTCSREDKHSETSMQKKNEKNKRNENDTKARKKSKDKLLQTRADNVMDELKESDITTCLNASAYNKSKGDIDAEEDSILTVQMLPSLDDEREERDERDEKDERDSAEQEQECTRRSCLLETRNFLAHFLFVMVLLFGGATVFALIEDPEVYNIAREKHNLTKEAVGTNLSTGAYDTLPALYSTNYTLWKKHAEFDHNITFWKHVETTYMINISARARESLLADMLEFVDVHEERRTRLAYEETHRNRMFVFLKWFYFVTIATTTIGYGDVSPKTDNGK